MKKQLPILILIISSYCFLNAQNSILIREIGKPSDSLIILGYDVLEKKEVYERIDDSTLKIKFDIVSADRLSFKIDKQKRWWSSIWIEPHIKQKEIRIDYINQTVKIKQPSALDSIYKLIIDLDDNDEFDKTLIPIYNFIEKNPTTYFSLWLFSHTHALYIADVSIKKKLFNMLSKSLNNYPEYKQVIASLGKRNYPKVGDLFKEFSLIRFNDSIFETNRIRNKWILLNFWTTSCGPCIKELDSLNSFNNLIDSSKAMIISISLDDKHERWRKSEFSKKNKWVSVWQENAFYGDLCLYYNVYSMPYFILFNNSKKIFFIKDGVNELPNIKNTFKEKKLLKVGNY